jgi:hypothetical protein
VKKKNPEAQSQHYGVKVNPVTGQQAPQGQSWIKSVMNGAWVLESDGTPWTCSVASETYWSS